MANEDRWHWHRRAQENIAQSYLTNSKRPESLVKGVYPTHCKGGRGAFLIDTNGKRYLDFICGLGTNLIGYGHEIVNRAIVEQVFNGYSHSLANTIEIETAEKLKELMPFIDCVKFLKTGSEACSAAVRIARAATRRDWVLSEGYHGHHDGFVSLTPPAIGVPAEQAISKLEGFDQFDEVAAIIVEPVMTDASDDRRKWLQALREACTKHGVMLIFDEVITGLRWPSYSVSYNWNIIPDLIVLGKAIANGMPLAAVGGKYAVMNCDEYFISSTYAGETLSLAAAKSTMTLLQSKFDVRQLWEKGGAFLNWFNALWPGGLSIDGYPSRGVLAAKTPLLKALFMQEACRAGLLFGPSWFLSFPAVNELENAKGAIQAIVTRLQLGEVRLDGELPKSPFAQRVREGA